MFHTVYILITMFLLPTTCYLLESRKRKLVGVDICKWYIFWTIGFRAVTTGAMQFLNSSYTMELLQLGEESRIIIMELGFAQFGIGIIAGAILISKVQFCLLRLIYMLAILQQPILLFLRMLLQ